MMLQWGSINDKPVADIILWDGLGEFYINRDDGRYPMWTWYDYIIRTKTIRKKSPSVYLVLRCLRYKSHDAAYNPALHGTRLDGLKFLLEALMDAKVRARSSEGERCTRGIACLFEGQDKAKFICWTGRGKVDEWP